MRLDLCPVCTPQPRYGSRPKFPKCYRCKREREVQRTHLWGKQQWMCAECVGILETKREEKERKYG